MAPRFHGIVIAVSVVKSPVIPTPAQDTDTTKASRERFELFNDCRPMELVIEDLSDDASQIGLDRRAIHVTAESRLRSARLYREESRRAGLTCT